MSVDKPGRIPVPYDTVNEQMIVCACVYMTPRDRGIFARRISIDRFFDPENKVFWGGLQEIGKRGLEFSFETLGAVTSGAAKLDVLERMLQIHPPPIVNIDYHVAALEWDSTRIAVAGGPVMELIKALQDPRTPRADVKMHAVNAARMLGVGGSSIVHATDDVIAASLKLLDATQSSGYGWPFGVEGFDYYADGRPRITPGAQPGLVTVLCGVPGSGKSTVAFNAAIGLIQQGRRVLYGSWEVPKEITMRNLAAIRLGIARARFAPGHPTPITPDERADLEDEQRALRDYVVFCDLPLGVAARARMTGGELNQRRLEALYGAISDSGADVAIFDLWKRCLASIEPNDEEQALVRQQAIAEETKCHCILVQQLRSKEVESREDKRPTRDSIKGSGAWLEVPDLICGVYRPGMYKAVGGDDVVELHVLKQRYGEEQIAIEFDWSGAAGTLKNGRSMRYDHPGAATPLDDFLTEKKGSKRK